MFLLSGFLPPLLSHFFFRSKYHLNTIKMRLSPGKMSRFFNFSLSVLIFIRRYQKQQKLSPFRCWKKSLGTAFFSNPLFFSTFFIFHPFVLWYLKGQNTYFPPNGRILSEGPRHDFLCFVSMGELILSIRSHPDECHQKYSSPKCQKMRENRSF